MSKTACVLALALFALGADWPEWRGSGRAGVWNEEGILERFPEGGLRYTWRVPIHEGYAGPAVAGGRVFVTDFVRGKGMAGTERALALDERTGKELWKHEWSVDYAGTEPVWANGPRATPTVDGDLVFVMGGAGRLLALEAASGKLVWQHDLVARYGATLPAWGTVSAPIVDGPRLIALVGGEKGALVVAFDKKSGRELWRALPTESEAGYAPPLLIRAGGVHQLIVWHPLAVSSLDPASGRIHWEQPFETKMGMTVATPVFDGRHLLVSAFFDGAMLLELDGAAPRARVLWKKKGISEQPQDSQGLHALITTPVLDAESIYGIDSYGELRRLRTTDGERIWESIDLVREKARWACGLIVRHGERYFVNTDRGELVIARFTPLGYREIDRTPLIEPTSPGGGKRELGAVHWSHPAYANRHIVVRNDREIVRASLEATSPAAPLVVVSDFDNPPFSSWPEGAAEPEGLEPDIVREIAATVGRPVRWDRRPFGELLSAVAAGEGELIAATLGITAERAKLVAFSRPYFQTSIAVVVRAGPGEPASLADLAGERVGASRGTTSEAALLRALPRAVAVLDPEDGLSLEALLRAGSIRAAVMDAPVADRLVRAEPRVLRRLTPDLAEEPYGFAVALAAKDLLATIDRVLVALEAGGRMDELRQRHGVERP